MNNPNLIFTLVKNALSPPIVIDSLKTGLFVGFILNLINHGGALPNGADISWGHVLLNFIIPFSVPAYSGARAAYTTCGLPVRNSTQPTTDHKSTTS
jgi:hypothetical protein